MNPIRRLSSAGFAQFEIDSSNHWSFEAVGRETEDARRHGLTILKNISAVTSTEQWKE